jgi:hypothetical protein
MSKINRALALAALSLSMTGCGYLDNLLDPARPETKGWTQFEAPDWYRTLYMQVESCSGVHRNYETLRFYYHVQRDSTDYLLDSDGNKVLAMTDPWSRRIWIGSQSLADPMVVEHEMMHYILNGVDGHPPKYFEDKCHLRQWVYTEADWHRDHDVMSAYYQAHGSLGLPVTPTGTAASASDSTDVGIPAGADQNTD